MNILRKIFKFIIYLLIFYFVLVVLEYARQGFISDFSLQKIDDRYINHSDSTYLISYADGKEHIYRNQNAMMQHANNKGFDFILNYKKRHLDSEFIESHQDILSSNPGAGMWLWKPYILYKTMKEAPENSIILYLDSAFHIKKPVFGFIDVLGDNDVMLVHDHGRKNGAYVKGDSFALTNCLDDACRYSPLIWSAVIMVRNNQNSRNLIKNWLDAASDIRILSGKSYGIKENYPEYMWHHFDQSVLSLIYHNNKSENIAKVKLIEPSSVREYFSWFHRKNSKSSPRKIWYSVYGSDPVINFSNNSKSMPSTALLNTPLLVYLRKLYIEHFTN